MNRRHAHRAARSRWWVEALDAGSLLVVLALIVIVAPLLIGGPR